MALFCTGPRTCLTANTLFGMSDRHNFVAHIVTKLVITLKRLFDQLEDFPAAYLVAAAATNTLIDINRFYEFGDPNFSSPSISHHGRHIVSFLTGISNINSFGED